MSNNFLQMNQQQPTILINQGSMNDDLYNQPAKEEPKNALEYLS
jgi:hypothetical protein